MENTEIIAAAIAVALTAFIAIWNIKKFRSKDRCRSCNGCGCASVAFRNKR